MLGYISVQMPKFQFLMPKKTFPKEFMILAIKLSTISNSQASMQKLNQTERERERKRQRETETRHSQRCKPRFPGLSKANPGDSEEEKFVSHPPTLSEIVTGEVTRQMNKAVEKIKLEIIYQITTEMIIIINDVIRESRRDTDFKKQKLCRKVMKTMNV